MATGRGAGVITSYSIHYTKLYEYADPAIEALPGLQKLMIRIGSNNRQLVKERARRLRDALAGNG